MYIHNYYLWLKKLVFLIVIAGLLPEFAEALITAVVREESGDGVDIPADTRMYIESMLFKTELQLEY